MAAPPKVRVACMPSPVLAGSTLRVQAILEGDDGGPASPQPATGVTLEVRSEDEATVHLAAAAMTLVVEEKGTLTAATASLLTDSAKAWTVNEWAGWAVRIASGAGAGQERLVRSNTATALVLETLQEVNEVPVGGLATVPAAADQYELHQARYRRTWDVPAARADETLLCVVRATSGATYEAAGKAAVRVDEGAV